MKVARSPEAVADLDEIWKWNAAKYGIPDADTYLAFLKQHVSDLCKTYRYGRSVQGRSNFRYLIARMRSGGHGHVLVYKVESSLVILLRVFHTAQDWKKSLAEDPD